MLHLLRSLQYLGMHGEARRLSFRALDIEQIGHVYEWLLDRTARRATEPVLGLIGTKSHDREVRLAELEHLKARGETALLQELQEATGRSVSTLKRALALPLTSGMPTSYGRSAATMMPCYSACGLLRVSCGTTHLTDLW